MGWTAGMLTATVLAALLVVPGASPTTSDDVAGTAPTAAWGMPPHSCIHVFRTAGPFSPSTRHVQRCRLHTPRTNTV